MKRLQTLALEQKEDARHGDATFPIQKYYHFFKAGLSGHNNALARRG